MERKTGLRGSETAPRAVRPIPGCPGREPRGRAVPPRRPTAPWGLLGARLTRPKPDPPCTALSQQGDHRRGLAFFLLIREPALQRLRHLSRELAPPSRRWSECPGRTRHRSPPKPTPTRTQAAPGPSSG